MPANHSADPLERFKAWYDGAVASGVKRPDGMTLATVGADGVPSARMVLYKGVTLGGFVFFTNYTSRKGQELESNPRAALVFYWDDIHRQVRVEGSVHKTSAEESDAYWRSRPRGSQLSAVVSDQSQVISGRRELEDAVAALDARFKGAEIPRPEHWGGYRLVPSEIEFWEGRTNRLHDRRRYRWVNGLWVTELLAP